PSRPSMADISIWQKTGHFYFALTLQIVVARLIRAPVAWTESMRSLAKHFGAAEAVKQFG
ncbi:MAG: hypothetical protein WB607_06200, partial [Candidatus Acidiferrum sp.]